MRFCDKMKNVQYHYLTYYTMNHSKIFTASSTMCSQFKLNSGSAAFNLLWTTKGQTKRVCVRVCCAVLCG